jgi:Arc/MetJ-type ribon-helix-helix transcriptional regulator
MSLSKQVAAKVSKAEYEQIQRLVRCGVYMNSSDFVRDATRRRLAELSSSARISTGRLKQELHDYMKEQGGLTFWKA